MTTMRTLMATMESIAPLSGAADWDNVGLLVGSADDDARSIVLTIDLTADVLREAIDAGANAIVAYHPPIFAPLKAITDTDEKSRLVLEAIRAGIAIYSPHTALDTAAGGVNDWLAAGLGTGAMSPLEALATLPSSQANKIVTMCPYDAVSAVHQAMSGAGAGMIGNYEQCAFQIRGDGTFFGSDDSNPALGEKGRVEHVEETRLEMVCGDRALGPVVAALRRAHPYEEPPVEIYPLKAPPRADAGQGRLLTLDAPATLDDLVARLKPHLGVTHLKVAPGRDAPEFIRHLGLCAGAGGSLLEAALATGAELFLTGEMRHHDALYATARGCTVILAGHTNTERGYLPVLRQRLADALPEFSVGVSEADCCPFDVR